MQPVMIVTGSGEYEYCTQTGTLLLALPLLTRLFRLKAIRQKYKNVTQFEEAVGDRFGGQVKYRLGRNAGEEE